MHRFVDLLDAASTSDLHIWGRYAKLLKRIWLAESSVAPDNNQSNGHDTHPNLKSLGVSAIARIQPFLELVLSKVNNAPCNYIMYMLFGCKLYNTAKSTRYTGIHTFWVQQNKSSRPLMQPCQVFFSGLLR